MGTTFHLRIKRTKKRYQVVLSIVKAQNSTLMINYGCLAETIYDTPVLKQWNEPHVWFKDALFIFFTQQKLNWVINLILGACIIICLQLHNVLCCFVLVFQCDCTTTHKYSSFTGDFICGRQNSVGFIQYMKVFHSRWRWLTEVLLTNQCAEYHTILFQGKSVTVQNAISRTICIGS